MEPAAAQRTRGRGRGTRGRGKSRGKGRGRGALRPGQSPVVGSIPGTVNPVQKGRGWGPNLGATADFVGTRGPFWGNLNRGVFCWARHAGHSANDGPLGFSPG